MFRPHKAKSKAKVQRASVGRLAITLLALFAFTFQSFVAQIHIHPAPSAVATTFTTGKVSQPGKLPANDDQSNCPICQVILHAGQFVTPSAIAFALPSFTLFFVATTADQPPLAQAGSHSWRSRAPPHI